MTPPDPEEKGAAAPEGHRPDTNEFFQPTFRVNRRTVVGTMRELIAEQAARDDALDLQLGWAEPTDAGKSFSEERFADKVTVAEFFDALQKAQTRRKSGRLKSVAKDFVVLSILIRHPLADDADFVECSRDFKITRAAVSKRARRLAKIFSLSDSPALRDAAACWQMREARLRTLAAEQIKNEGPMVDGSLAGQLADALAAYEQAEEGSHEQCLAAREVRKIRAHIDGAERAGAA